MKAVILILMQVVIASGLLYGYYHVFLKNNKFHRYNRFYLLGATLVSLIIPFLKIPLYFTSEEADASILYRSMQLINGQEEMIITQSANSWEQLLTWQNISIILYALITLFILTRLIIALKRIIRLRYQYPSARIENIQFIKTTEPGTPFSFFNWLFWNKKIEVKSEKGQQIFRHEWFHIQQKHSVDIMFMEWLNVLCWFNPFYYLVKKELKTIHEFLADEFAVQHFSRGAYAELLLMQAFDTEYKIVNPFFHTQIKRRIAMITTSSKPGYQYLRKIMVLPICALVVSLFAFTYKSQEVFPELLPGEKITVVIDAGHGGNDHGANANAIILEKDINLALAKAVVEMNEDPNIEIILTRESDVNLALNSRTDVSMNRKADLFISLHVGSADPSNEKTTENKNGIEVIISRKNTRFDAQNRVLATIMINHFENIYSTNKEILVKQTGIWVLDKNNCPSVLIECGYLTNPGDLSFITQKENQHKIAKSILAGIHQYAKEKNRLLSTISTQHLNDTIPAKAEPLIVIDGKIKKYAVLKDIDPDKIEVINVLKDETAIDKYGDKGINGVIEITTKNKSIEITTKASPGKPALSSKDEVEKALLVVDGKKYPSLTYYEKEAKMNQVSIASINVLKGQTAVSAYGAEGINGVIEITTSLPKIVTKPTITSDSITLVADSIFFSESVTALFVIDGKVQLGLLPNDLNKKMSPDDIESINVLKGESAIQKYGAKGKNGVIEITSKKQKETADKIQQ
ncbi:MAG: N-acetylmuramoyl-L-alanine amidase [Chitinophagaceae bacterium]|nr:N-acetylmuramoyl-L-alanine amidase [Chitinophagaceae bacterium]